MPAEPLCYYSSSIMYDNPWQANSTIHKVGTTSALVLGSRQPRIRALLEEFNVKAMLPDVESEDEFESADEGVSNLNLYFGQYAI